MRLVKLDIEQLPGVDPIRLTDFTPGTNFVLGPNAIGKSSLIRALHYLLADSRKTDPLALRLRAAFVDGMQRWEVERDGPNQRWFCDGETSAPPPLPTADALACYWLRAETLIAPDEDDDLALERRFRAALAGGIDLTQVRREANLQIPGFPQSQRRDWQTASKNRKPRKTITGSSSSSATAGPSGPSASPPPARRRQVSSASVSASSSKRRWISAGHWKAIRQDSPRSSRH